MTTSTSNTDQLAMLPTDGTSTPEQQETLEALGFRLGAVRADCLRFRDVELPEGWTREEAHDARWSYLCDERGFRRLAIFHRPPDRYSSRMAYVLVLRVPEWAAT